MTQPTLPALGPGTPPHLPANRGRGACYPRTPPSRGTASGCAYRLCWPSPTSMFPGSLWEHPTQPVRGGPTPSAPWAVCTPGNWRALFLGSHCSVTAPSPGSPQVALSNQRLGSPLVHLTVISNQHRRDSVCWLFVDWMCIRARKNVLPTCVCTRMRVHAPCCPLVVTLVHVSLHTLRWTPARTHLPAGSQSKAYRRVA